LKQHIIEFKAKNAELRKENTMISDLRNKLSVFDAEIAKLKYKNVKTLKANGKYNERYDTENVKLKVRIEKLKSENIEFKDRLMKVK